MTEGASECQQKLNSVKQRVNREAKRHPGFCESSKKKPEEGTGDGRERTRTGSLGQGGREQSRGQGGRKQKHQEREGELWKFGND